MTANTSIVLPKSVTDASFASIKSHTQAMIKQLVPGWAQGMVNVTDEDIYAVSTPAAQAIVAAWLSATKPTSNT